MVVGVPDDYWGEQIAAIVRKTESGAPLDAVAIKAWCKERISAHKVPSAWFFVDDFPMTPSGKIQKFRLRDEIIAGDLVPDEVTSSVSGAAS